MVTRRSDVPEVRTEGIHDGTGAATCFSMLSDYARPGTGFMFVHDDMLEPGTVIGEHRHEGDEEIYFVIEGHGTMVEDGAQSAIGPGDLSIVRSGHSHGLVNSTDSPMRLIVIAARILC